MVTTDVQTTFSLHRLKNEATCDSAVCFGNLDHIALSDFALTSPNRHFTENHSARDFPKFCLLRRQNFVKCHMLSAIAMAYIQPPPEGTLKQIAFYIHDKFLIV